jgi:hypothetical protein
VFVLAAGCAIGLLILAGIVASSLVLVSRKPRPRWQKALAGTFLGMLFLGFITIVGVGAKELMDAQKIADPGKPVILHLRIDSSKSGWNRFTSAMAEGATSGFVTARLEQCGFRVVPESLFMRRHTQAPGGSCDFQCGQRLARDNHAALFTIGEVTTEGEDGLVRLRVYRTEREAPVGKFELRGRDLSDMLRNLRDVQRHTSCRDLTGEDPRRAMDEDVSERQPP